MLNGGEMRFLFKILSIALLSLLIATEAQFVLLVLVSDSTPLEGIELTELGETESGGEEKTDNSSEELEKFFSAHQMVFNNASVSTHDRHFVYKRSSKSNLHFEVISPPPQAFC
jgi:molybdenum cofactor biosynthesis enzyme MoaA